jgi:hypothetical protein
MATTISASTTSNTAYNVVPDTSGSLVIQTGATPTTALTISSSQVVSLNNDATIHGLTVGLGAGSVSNNTAVGSSALAGANSGSGYNTAVGYQAGYTNTTGTQCDAFGANALYSNTTSQQNASFGNFSSYSNTTGSYNAAFGVNAFYHNTTGGFNTALGCQALVNNTTASYNTAVGYQAGYTNVLGGANTFIGNSAGFSFAASSAGNTFNTFIGNGSGSSVTSGTNNTILGSFSGNQGGLNITTSSNYIVLSDGAGNPSAYRNNGDAWYFGLGTTAGSGNIALNGYATSGWGPVIAASTGAIGSQSYVWYVGSNSNIKGGTSYNTLTCTAGGTSGGVSLTSGATAWVSASDSRLKNVTGTYTTALADIAQIQPVKFTWKDDETNKPQVGVIAQSVQAVVPEAIDTVRHSKEDETDYLGVRYTELIPILIASIQELNTLVTAQATTITALEAKLKAANVAGF